MKNNPLREELFFNIRDNTDVYDNIDDKKLNDLMFLRRESRRLTIKGIMAMSYAYTPYHFKNTRQFILAKDLLAISRYTCYPYFINSKEIVLFGREDSFLLKLLGGDIDAWISQITPPEKK